MKRESRIKYDIGCVSKQFKSGIVLPDKIYPHLKGIRHRGTN